MCGGFIPIGTGKKYFFKSLNPVFSPKHEIHLIQIPLLQGRQYSALNTKALFLF